MITTLLHALLRRLGPGLLSPRWPQRLAPGETATLHGLAGRWLRVQRGRIWLTEPGDPDDHFVGRGQCLRIAGDGPVVLQNDSGETAWFRVAAAEPMPDWALLDDATLRDIGLPPVLRQAAAEQRRLRGTRLLSSTGG